MSRVDAGVDSSKGLDRVIWPPREWLEPRQKGQSFGGIFPPKSIGVEVSLVEDKGSCQGQQEMRRDRAPSFPNLG